MPKLTRMNPSKIDQLHRLMSLYKGRDHSVSGFVLAQGAPHFQSLGRLPEGVPDAQVLFEIGSITKVFTAILLCVLVEEGKVDPQAPLREMAADLADVPDWITPARLVSHTSGLPRIHVPVWKAVLKPLPKDPYAEFSRQDLLDWMHDWSQKAKDGKRAHAYSNLGMGLLGEAMAIQAGVPFIDLLTEKLLAPLGMRDTVQRLAPAQMGRFAAPKDTKGRRVPDWSFQSMAAAGCLRSCTADLARFAQGVLGAFDASATVLDRAIVRSAQPLLGLGLRGGLEPAAQCSGWFRDVHGKTGLTMLHHDGATAGSTSAIYICPDKGQACAVLSNNGIVANLWAGTKFGLSSPSAKAHDIFCAD